MKAIDLNAWNAATIYVYNRIVTDRACGRCGGYVLKSDSENYPYQCLKCDEDLYRIETTTIDNGEVPAEKFAEQVALAYNYMIAEKEDEK